jgi:ADP-heptose:LPS heptosyltransferase
VSQFLKQAPFANDLVDIAAKKWEKRNMPRRLLAIRLQAMGDLVITLPYLQGLRNKLPEGTELDLLTREEVESIPKNLKLFDHVYSIGGGRNWEKQLFYAYLLLPKLLLRRYDVVIDLQNNSLSKTVRKTIMPTAWSEFDRFAPVPAGECTRMAIEAIGLGECGGASGFKLKTGDSCIDKLLKENGWDSRSKLVLLNPAGAFENRNWPIENYVLFAELWLEKFPFTQFVTMGTDFISVKANYLKQQLGDRMINLLSITTPVQAFAIIQTIQFALSEDSGLMHMAWTSGTPTLALFGSTRRDRAAPLGKHTMLLSSSDLSCGNCMLAECKFGDNHCITRYSAQYVFEKGVSLLTSLEKIMAKPQLSQSHSKLLTQYDV